MGDDSALSNHQLPEKEPAIHSPTQEGPSTLLAELVQCTPVCPPSPSPCPPLPLPLPTSGWMGLDRPDTSLGSKGQLTPPPH